jgi:hypothetical protein
LKEGCTLILMGTPEELEEVRGRLAAGAAREA